MVTLHCEQRQFNFLSISRPVRVAVAPSQKTTRMESWFLISDTPNTQGTYRTIVIVEYVPTESDLAIPSDFLLASESNAAGSASRSHRDTLQASARCLVSAFLGSY